MISVKKKPLNSGYNKYQQAAFELKQNAIYVEYFPDFITNRYNIEFGGSKNNRETVKESSVKFGLSKKEGRWLANGEVVGNTVQVVTQLENRLNGKDISEKEAINIINSSQPSQSVNIKIASNVQNIVKSENFQAKIGLNRKSTATDEDIKRINAYAKSRGIDLDTINEAEQSGFLQKNSLGISFLGRNENGEIKSKETRLLQTYTRLDGKTIRYLCQKGSDRSYPAILPGSQKSVHIVEGGFSALGAKELAKAKGEDPTIIVSGGKDSWKFFEREHVRKIIEDADITIWQENAANENDRKLVHEATQKQAQAALEAGAKSVNFTNLQDRDLSIKDAADLNLERKKQMELEKSKFKIASYT